MLADTNTSIEAGTACYGVKIVVLVVNLMYVVANDADHYGKLTIDPLGGETTNLVIIGCTGAN